VGLWKVVRGFGVFVFLVSLSFLFLFLVLTYYGVLWLTCSSLELGTSCTPCMFFPVLGFNIYIYIYEKGSIDSKSKSLKLLQIISLDLNMNEWS
jgi:hypothetical protein